MQLTPPYYSRNAEPSVMASNISNMHFSPLAFYRLGDLLRSLHCVCRKYTTMSSDPQPLINNSSCRFGFIFFCPWPFPGMPSSLASHTSSAVRTFTTTNSLARSESLFTPQAPTGHVFLHFLLKTKWNLRI